MVRIQGPTSDYDRLDALVRAVVTEVGAYLDVTGWTRKTYDVYDTPSRHDRRKLLVRVESFVTTNGQIQVFDDAGLAVAQALAQRVEAEFDVGEAVVIRA